MGLVEILEKLGGLLEDCLLVGRFGSYSIFAGEPNLNITVALGVSLWTDQKVVVALSDRDILPSLEALTQASLSKNKNLFLILFDGGESNLFKGLPSLSSFFIGNGFKFIDYSDYLSSNKLDDIRHHFDTLYGPAVIYISGVEYG